VVPYFDIKNASGCALTDMAIMAQVTGGGLSLTLAANCTRTIMDDEKA